MTCLTRSPYCFFFSFRSRWSIFQHLTSCASGQRGWILLHRKRPVEHSSRSLVRWYLGELPCFCLFVGKVACCWVPRGLVPSTRPHIPFPSNKLCRDVSYLIVPKCDEATLLYERAWDIKWGSVCTFRRDSV